MEPFTTLTGVAAPMPMQNIDTDKIIPARFLKTIKRSGLGVHLFDPLRFDKDGKEKPDFVLNQEPYPQSPDHHRAREFRLRLLARARPLGAAGFRHPLHHRAGFRRHLLQQQLQERHPADPPAARGLRPVDRRHQAGRQCPRHHRPCPPGGDPPERRGNRLRDRPVPQTFAAERLDDIGQTLQHGSKIDGFEAARRASQPWLPSTAA